MLACLDWHSLLLGTLGMTEYVELLVVNLFGRLKNCFLSQWRRRSTNYFLRLHDFAGTIPRCYTDIHAKNFSPRTVKLWSFFANAKNLLGLWSELLQVLKCQTSRFFDESALSNFPFHFFSLFAIIINEITKHK